MKIETSKMMLHALRSVFWYEGFLTQEKEENFINNTYDEDCWLVMFIKDLREAKTQYGWYNIEDLNKFNEQFIEPDSDCFEVYGRHTVIWQMLVEMFGNCGTSPRTGWIEERQECANFLQMIVDAD